MRNGLIVRSWLQTWALTWFHPVCCRGGSSTRTSMQPSGRSTKIPGYCGLSLVDVWQTGVSLVRRVVGDWLEMRIWKYLYDHGWYHEGCCLLVILYLSLFLSSFSQLHFLPISRKLCLCFYFVFFTRLNHDFQSTLHHVFYTI